MQVGQAQPSDLSIMDHSTPHMEGDDIDADLSNLEESLQVANISTSGDITSVPELGGYVKWFK